MFRFLPPDLYAACPHELLLRVHPGELLVNREVHNGHDFLTGSRGGGDKSEMRYRHASEGTATCSSATCRFLDVGRATLRPQTGHGGELATRQNEPYCSMHACRQLISRYQAGRKRPTQVEAETTHPGKKSRATTGHQESTCTPTYVPHNCSDYYYYYCCCGCRSTAVCWRVKRRRRCCRGNFKRKGAARPPRQPVARNRCAPLRVQ